MKSRRVTILILSFVFILGFVWFCSSVEAMNLYTPTIEPISEIKIEGIGISTEKLSQNGKAIPSAFERVKRLSENERSGRIIRGCANMFSGTCLVVLGKRLYDYGEGSTGIGAVMGLGYGAIGVLSGIGFGFLFWTGMADAAAKGIVRKEY